MAALSVTFRFWGSMLAVTYMHAQLTHTGLYVDVIAKELALSEATWCYWISVFSIVYLAGNQSLVLNLPHTTCSAPILHHLFSLSCFPHAIFTFLLLLVGRSWHVGLSGPLILIWEILIVFIFPNHANWMVCPVQEQVVGKSNNV